MNSWNTGDVIFALFLGMAAGGALTLGMLSSMGQGPVQVEARIRQEAIENGAGEWRADPKTGANSFVWLKRD
jgi:hypothetical protein